MKTFSIDRIIKPKIDGCGTVFELAEKGCPVCHQKLYPEASTGFGSLWCADHGIIWQWIPNRKGSPLKWETSKVWKNHITGKTSVAWNRKFRLEGGVGFGVNLSL